MHTEKREGVENKGWGKGKWERGKGGGGRKRRRKGRADNGEGRGERITERRTHRKRVGEEGTRGEEEEE